MIRVIHGLYLQLFKVSGGSSEMQLSLMYCEPCKGISFQVETEVVCVWDDGAGGFF